MSGNARTANKDPVSALLFTEQSSMFFPKPWQTVSNFYWDIVGYSPQTTGTYGGTTTWSIPNNVTTYFGRPLLKWDNPAVAIPAGSSYRYDDFIGYGQWESASVKYGSQFIDVLDSEFTKWKFYDEQMPQWKRAAITNIVHGPLPAATRALNLANGVTCIVELPFFFGRGYSSALPLVMGSDLQFLVQWRQFGQIIDCDAVTAPTPTQPTINDQVLLLVQYYGADNEQANLLQHASSGILKLIDAQIKTTFVMNAAATNPTLVIPTPNVNLPTTYQNIVVRRLAQLSTNFQIQRWVMRGGFTDPLVQIGPNAPSWSTTSGNIRQPTIGPRVVKPYASAFFRENPGLLDPIVQMDVSMQPLASSFAAGSLNTQFLAGFQVVLPLLTPAGPEQCQVDVCSTVKTVIKAAQGNLYRAFQ